MKSLSLFLLSVFLYAPSPHGIHDISFRNIDGSEVKLQQYKNKKILVIVMPLSAQDTSISPNQLKSAGTEVR